MQPILTGTPLAQRLIDFLAGHPERHDQDVITYWTREPNDGYTCGTRGCIAGWTVIFAYGLDVKDDGRDWNTSLDKRAGELVLEPDGSRGDWISTAMKLLEIPESQYTEFTDGVFAADEHEAIENVARLTGARLPEDFAGDSR